MSTTAVRAGARTSDAGTGHGLSRMLLGFTLFIALGLLVPMLLLAEPNEHRSAAWVVTFGYTVVAAARLAVLAGRGERRLFEFIFWLFVYVFFGLSPTVQMRQDLIPGTTQDLDPALDMPTALLSGAGIACLALGFAWAYRRPPRHPPGWTARSRPGVFERFTFDISVVRLIVLSLVGLAGAAYYVGKVGMGTLVGSRTATLLVEDQLWPDPSVAGIVRAVSSFPVLIAAHGWWSLSRSAGRKSALRTIALLLTAVSLIVTNPVSSSRYASGVVWGSFLGPLGAYRSRTRSSVTLVSLIAALLFLFPLANLFRSVHISVRRTGFLDEYGGNGDYDAFGQLSNAILYHATMPFEFGRQLLGQIFFWLPRSVWPDKPVNTGTLLAEFRGYTYTNLSAPIWAELLLNFGFVGVLLVSVLIGLGLGRLDRAFRDMSDRGVLPIATSVLPFYLLILLRGSLLQATGTLVVLLASIVFITRRRRVVVGASPSSSAGPSAPHAGR